MKKITFVLLAGVVLWGCAKKATPTTTTEAKTAEAPKTETVSTPSLSEGKITYESKCGRCHGLPETDKYTKDKWVGLVNWMAPKAKLSEIEKANVLAYVQANAK